MDFIYLYLAAARKIFKASRWDFKTSLQMKKSKSLTFKENKREHELYTWTHIIQKKRKRLSLGLQMYDLDIHCSSGRKKGLFSSDLVEEEAQCIRWFLNPSPSTAWPGTLKPIIRNTSFIYSFVNSLSHLLSPLIYSSKNLFTSDCPVPNPVLSVESSEIIAASLQMSALQRDRHVYIIIKSGVLSKICYVDAFELWCWRRLPWTARRSNRSILREIYPEYSLEGLMLKLKLQYFGHLMWRADSLEKTWCWKDWRQKEKAAAEDEKVR